MHLSVPCSFTTASQNPLDIINGWLFSITNYQFCKITVCVHPYSMKCISSPMLLHTQLTTSPLFIWGQLSGLINSEIFLHNEWAQLWTSTLDCLQCVIMPVHTRMLHTTACRIYTLWIKKWCLYLEWDTKPSIHSACHTALVHSHSDLKFAYMYRFNWYSIL